MHLPLNYQPTRYVHHSIATTAVPSTQTSDHSLYLIPHLALQIQAALHHTMSTSSWGVLPLYVSLSWVVTELDVHPGLVLLVGRAQCSPHGTIALEAAAKCNLPNPVAVCQPLPSLDICQHIPAQRSHSQRSGLRSIMLSFQLPRNIMGCEDPTETQQDTSLS